MYNASWEQLGVKYRVDAENLFSLVDLILTIPAHSVECERGFSQMKRVKTDWRNQLTSTALTSTLRILMEGPSIKEFDPLPAIIFWNSVAKRVRRPFQPPYGKRTPAVEAEKEIVESDDGE